MERVGDVLRRIRLSQGLSVVELSKRSGVSTVSIHACEKGHYSTTLTTLSVLAKGLGVSLSELLGDMGIRGVCSTLPFHRVLKARRRELKMTQKQLASAVGVRQVVISHYELNKSTPSVDVLCKLAETLDISVSKLIGGGLER